jgi:hypothetical protein
MMVNGGQWHDVAKSCQAVLIFEWLSQMPDEHYLFKIRTDYL